MNIFRRRQTPAQRLEATMKPNRAYWSRRLAQFTPERRLRALMNAGMHSPELFQ